jgi:hypothetical protein
MCRCNLISRRGINFISHEGFGKQLIKSATYIFLCGLLLQYLDPKHALNALPNYTAFKQHRKRSFAYRSKLFFSLDYDTLINQLNNIKKTSKFAIDFQ